MSVAQRRLRISKRWRRWPSVKLGRHEPQRRQAGFEMKSGAESVSKSRCTQRKHVIGNGQSSCDCKALILWPTAARNALVVTVLDPKDIFGA